MDKRDLSILKAITDLETDNLQEISEATGIANSTVHYRINKLREEGIIKNDLGEIAREELGFDITVVTNVSVEYTKGHSKEIGEEIADIEGVAHVYWVMGTIDFIVVSHIPNHAELQHLFDSFHSIDGIRETNSTYVVDTIKDNPNPLANYGLEKIHDTNSDDVE